MATVTVSFALDDQQDRDLLRWLDSLPKRGKSEAIRDALRAHLGRGGITLGDVYQAVKELERKLQNGASVAHTPALPADVPEEPPDVAEALDKLGL